jgi:peptidoglycan/LPS O-acetylase OafA/YrhL
MISGFVIMMSLARLRHVREFASARFCRLYPAYWVAAILTFSVIQTFELPDRQMDFRTLLVNLTMLQGFFGVPNVDGPYWTLHVELCFYFVLGLLFALGWRRHAVGLLTLLVLFVFAQQNVSALRDLPGWWRVELAFPLVSFAPFFVLGLTFYEARERWRPVHAIAVCLCLTAVLFNKSWEERAIVACLIGFTYMATHFRLPWLANSVLVFLGTISYSLYLVHAGIGYVIIRKAYAAGWDGHLAIGLAVLTAILLACLLTFGVERPANDWFRARLRGVKRASFNAGAAPVLPAPEASVSAYPSFRPGAAELRTIGPAR